MKEFEFKEGMDIEELLKEVQNIDGVEVRLKFVENEEDMSDNIITTKYIRTELERVMILIEEQKEYEIAVDKLKELYDLFEEIEWGEYYLECEWD